ncbi:MAG: TM2 domain-containing protein [Eggerthellaceae bacterium]
MAADNEDKGYWGGYPSYLLGDRVSPESSQRLQSECEDRLFAAYPDESEGDGGDAYWGSQERLFNTYRSSAAGFRKGACPYDGISGKRAFQAGVIGKSHVAAGLLAIFLGCFGIHKFYLGYNSTGIIMLAVTVIGSIFSLGLAGMVMGVIALIEGIIYLAMGQVCFDRTYVQNKKEWF